MDYPANICIPCADFAHRCSMVSSTKQFLTTAISVFTIRVFDKRNFCLTFGLSVCPTRDIAIPTLGVCFSWHIHYDFCVNKKNYWQICCWFGFFVKKTLCSCVWVCEYGLLFFWDRLRKIVVISKLPKASSLLDVLYDQSNIFYFLQEVIVYKRHPVGKHSLSQKARGSCQPELHHVVNDLVGNLD